MSEEPGPERALDTARGPLVGRGRTAAIHAGSDGTVVKLFEPWVPDALVEREATALRLLERADVPAPRLRGFIERDGRRGIVIDRVDGASLIGAMRARPWTLRHESRRLARLQHAIAGVQADELPSFRGALRSAIDRATGVPEDLRDAALRALDRLPNGAQLCHGDFHPDNVMIGRHGPVVIDWMTAARGVPAADVARSLVVFAVGAVPPDRPLDAVLVRVFRRIITNTYRRERLRLGDVTEDEVFAWMLPVAVARYAEGIASDEPALSRLTAAARIRRG